MHEYENKSSLFWLLEYPLKDAPAAPDPEIHPSRSPKRRANRLITKRDMPFKEKSQMCTYCVTMNARIQVIFCWVDHIRLPRLDTDQLVSATRMRSSKCEKIFLRPSLQSQNTLCAICHSVSLFLQYRLRLPGDCMSLIIFFIWLITALYQRSAARDAALL